MGFCRELEKKKDDYFIDELKEGFMVYTAYTDPGLNEPNTKEAKLAITKHIVSMN